MAVSFVLNHNTGSATSATPTFTLAGDVAAGNVLVLFAGFDNSGSNLPTVSSIDTPAGETASWSLLTGARVAANATATAGAGVIGEMWAIKTTQQWPSGTTVTVTLSASVKVALLCKEFSGALKTLRGTSGTGVSTAGAPSAVTSGTALVTGDLVVGGAVCENSASYTTDIDTTNGSWSTILNAHVGGGAAAAQVEACLQHKIVTATGVQTYNPAGVTANDAGAVIVSLVPDPNLTVSAQDTAGTWVAFDPTVDLGANGETTTGTGTAYDATVTTEGGGGGTVALRGYGGFGNLATAGGTLNVPYRTDIAVGDAMVICVSTNGSTATTPAGWTVIKALTTPTNPKVYGFLKLADSTDVSNASGGGNVAITIASSTASGRMGAYSSVDGTTPQDVAATEIQNAATTTTIVIPAPAAGTAGRMEIAGYGANSASSTYTPGAPFTERADFFVDNGNVTVGKGGGMADYSDTAGSGSGVTVTIDAGARANAGWIVALKPAAGGAPTTNAPAELATGTGTSNDALTAVGGNADTTNGTGAATDAVASVATNADTTSGTGAAFDATVSTAAQTNAPAELASGAGAANDTSAAVGTFADTTVGTGLSLDAIGSVGGNADTTSGAGTANQPTIAVTVNADTTTGIGTGYDATVSTAAQTNAPAELASGTGSAFDATVPANVAAGHAAGTGTGYDATVSTVAQTNAPAGVASASGTANDATITITVPAGTTVAAGTAYDAAVQALYLANAGHATGIGSAHDATVAIGAIAESATGTTTAYDAAMSTKWVYRPNEGTTSRPNSGTTARPFAGTTVRP